MQHPSIAGLKHFIANQPADRVITSQDSWNACAVGDYAREMCGGHEIALPNGDDYTPVKSDPVLLALFRDEGVASDYDASWMIEHGIEHVEEPTAMDALGFCDGPTTYGELQVLLSDPSSWDRF